MNLWIDITNTPHVNVLLPIIKHLKAQHNIIISARNFSETIPLLAKNGITPIVFGNYQGKSRIKKIYGLATRLIEIYLKMPDFDISLSLGGNYTAVISQLKRKPSIIVSDNDISFKALAFRFGSHYIFPSYFKYGHLIAQYGIKKSQIHIFDGFKEDIYLASFKPDPNFLSQLPFNDYITIRPENLKASYVPRNSHTIVPQLFRILQNENILYLPRFTEEKQFAQGYANVFIPDKPLNGLDVCYYTKAMLTGAGTFAREAALLGIPAVSFFPGKTLLTVDVKMQEMGMEFYSRNPETIKNYIKSATKRTFDQDRCKLVFSQMITILDDIFNKHSH